MTEQPSIKTQLIYILLVCLLVALGALVLMSLPVEQSAAPASGVTVYRWQDEEGAWHFSEQQPEQTHEVIQVQDPMLVQMDKPKPPDLGGDQEETKGSRSFVIQDSGGPYGKHRPSQSDEDGEERRSDDAEHVEFERQINQLQKLLDR